MLNLFDVIKPVVLALSRFGIAFAICFYLAHFTEIQSLIIATLGLCALDGYRLAFRIAAKQKPQFEPFCVRVEPNWHSLCRDFGLADIDKLEDLLKTSRTAPAEYSILHKGLNFTMLSPTLFYSNDHLAFFGELDFKIPIEELKPEFDKLGGGFAPQFYIKRSVGGEKNNTPVIEFGLVTQESLKKSFHPADHTANVPFARLPEVVFHNYFNNDFDYDRANKVEKESELRLAEYNWTPKQRDPEDSWLHLPFEIEHKYLRLVYRGI